MRGELDKIAKDGHGTDVASTGLLQDIPVPSAGGAGQAEVDSSLAGIETG